MPYIHPKQRARIGGIVEFRQPESGGPGEFNYRVTQLINSYIRCYGLSYHTINDVVGALEGAKLEFYRRIAVPYEDKKCAENGDVYPSQEGQ